MRALMIGLLAAGVTVLVAAYLVWYLAEEQLDKRLNRVVADPTAPVPTLADQVFHRSLLIVDLHADTLKWERNLLQRGRWGHVDLPRLVEGNVALQVFAIVTKSPILRPSAEDPGTRCVSAQSLDVAPLLAAVQGRPAFSPRARALFQARRLQHAAEISRELEGPELRPILDAGDLRRLIEDRRAGRHVVGAVLALEGGHWIGDPDTGPDSVDAGMRELFEAGVRVFAPTHRFDNALSGAGEGCERYGLTALGRRALEVAQGLGMVVDLAHISPQGLRDAVDLLEQPFIISHTGVQAGCEPPCRPARNLRDADIALALKHDGLIGVGYWPEAIGESAWRIADVMQHIMGIAAGLGLEPGRNVALGSDFDGSVAPYFDASQLEILTAIMRRRPEPFDEAAIRNITGLNACRLFARILPGGSPEAADELCEPPELPGPAISSG